jgi:hypothetical protein
MAPDISVMLDRQWPTINHLRTWHRAEPQDRKSFINWEVWRTCWSDVFGCYNGIVHGLTYEGVSATNTTIRVSTIGRKFFVTQLSYLGLGLPSVYEVTRSWFSLVVRIPSWCEKQIASLSRDADCSSAAFWLVTAMFTVSWMARPCI